MTTEEFKNLVPLAMQVTDSPNWGSLYKLVKAEFDKKDKMLRSQTGAPDIETVRYLQGILAGLEFTLNLPEVLKKDYQNILRDSQDSQ